MSVYNNTQRGMTGGRVKIPASATENADLTDWVLLTDTSSHPKRVTPVIITNLCGEGTVAAPEIFAGVFAQPVDLQWDPAGYWKFRIQLSANIEANEQVGFIAMSMFG